MKNRDAVITGYDENQRETFGIHPETNWEQVKVGKNANLKEYLGRKPFKITEIQHNMDSYPRIMAFTYKYGGGVMGYDEFPYDSENPIYDPNIGVEYPNKSSVTITGPEDYEDYGDVTVVKNEDNGEYYISFSNSENCIMIVFS